MNIKDYDIMQDRDMDESHSNGVWDLSYDLLNADLDQETLYNYLQDFKDIVKADLEAKLAEKDRAIENWQTMYQSVMQSSHNGIEEDKRLREQLAEKEKEFNWLHQKFAKYAESDQDKISFCIEQLEKVKAELVNKVSPVKLSYNEYVQGVFSKIDNQIKQLKEMK